MSSPDMKNTLLNPVYAAIELIRSFLRPAYKGAPYSWTMQMTAIVVLLPFIILILHLWDADIVRAAAGSTNIVMEILRTVTDAIRTVVWLAVSLIVWLVTAFILSPGYRGQMRPILMRWHGWATLVLASIVAGSIPTEIGKLAIGRARPFLLDQYGAAYFSPFKGEFLYESFPSGHSMMAGIMMMSLSIFLPRWRFPIIVVGLLFCISRLAAGAHFPTDIVAGCTIGLLATWWVARYMATRNIIFSLDDKHTLPTV